MEPGAWAFAGVAASLARALHVPVVDRPAHRNYCFYRPADVDADSFIPAEAVRVASDKRLQAALFAGAGVPTPDTALVADLAEARRSGRWVLKYPVGCGAAGRRLLTEETRLPGDWPKPLLIQAFVEMDRPEVYRLYGAAGRRSAGTSAATATTCPTRRRGWPTRPAPPTSFWGSRPRER